MHDVADLKAPIRVGVQLGDLRDPLSSLHAIGMQRAAERGQGGHLFGERVGLLIAEMGPWLNSPSNRYERLLPSQSSRASCTSSAHGAAAHQTCTTPLRAKLTSTSRIHPSILRNWLSMAREMLGQLSLLQGGEHQLRSDTL